MLEYTKINPPTMEMKAAGHNPFFGTAQGIPLVVVRDTPDDCRTVKLPIVLVPGLILYFLQLWQLKKVSKLFSLRQGPSWTMAYFQFS